MDCLLAARSTIHIMARQDIIISPPSNKMRRQQLGHWAYCGRELAALAKHHVTKLPAETGPTGILWLGGMQRLQKKTQGSPKQQ